MSTTTTTTTTTTRPFPTGIPGITVIPDSGYFGNSWPASGSIPKSFSSAGWTVGNRGFVQQTFLGASIRSFNMNGAFGDSSSTLSVELVNDEFNVSDRTDVGFGDDPYHSGVSDRFVPPPVGSPVFFKFGMNFATIPEAYAKTFDDLYGTNLTGTATYPTGGQEFDILNFTNLNDTQLVDLENTKILDFNSYFNSPSRGRYHLVFGGILQSYTQNKGMGGNTLFSVNVTDPREILSNVVLVLNNYAGSIFDTNNILNIYGFLEHNASDATISEIKRTLSIENRLTKTVNAFGSYAFSGDDTYVNILNPTPGNPQISFPITGTGMSRRGPQGIPYYRIKQAVNALMQYEFILPSEYANMGFGGAINFRGHNYVIDFGSLPNLNDLYFFDFDQINLLDLALEICDITSRDLFVSLLPVIQHPACSNIFAWNNTHANDPTKFISGIIRLDAIDRSKQPNYGAIKYYIDSLANFGVYTENQDIGFELSNVVTDKFIVGAQETDLHFFTSNSDRNNLGDESIGDQWKLETSFKQQILPYYGLLGNNAVTIPKGYGAYQQILLDATSLNANGVGSYYVATEMELRCALVSFERWKDFLKLYNDIYLESVEDSDAVDSAALLQSPNVAGLPPVDDISDNYAVTVPRSVFVTYAPQPFGTDGLPYSPCNPPYGYPLYYKRMTKIGIPEGGLVDIQYRFSSLLSGLAGLKSADKSNFKALLFSEIERLKDMIQSGSELNAAEKAYLTALENFVSDAENANEDDITKMISVMEDTLDNFKPIFYSPDLSKIAKRNTQNALKVYNFVRNVAEECLGKKFLVKLPKVVNPNYLNKITTSDDNPNQYLAGPFGFKPRAVGARGGFGQEFSTNPTPYKTAVDNLKNSVGANLPISKFFLSSGISNGRLTGELNVSFNPILDQYEFNYSPVNEGGFFNFDLYQNFITNDKLSTLLSAGYGSLPSGMQNQLIPIDLTNFINNNSRISPYVRFNHSEHLSFDGFNASDFTQSVATAEGHIPNLSYDLDNVHPDDTYSLQNNNNSSQEPLPEQVAYVKCSVDDKLYMAPKTVIKQTPVFAQDPVATKTLKAPRKIYDACADKYVDSFSYYKSTFRPNTGPGSPVNILDFVASSGLQLSTSVTIPGMLINTSVGDLDTDNVYALITLPGRVLPTKDARLRDGPFQSSNAEKFKHFMTMDVIKGLEGFDKPSTLPKPPKSILNDPRYGSQISPNNRIHAWLAAKKANDALLSFGLPRTLNYTFPSPVYPDLVAIPLMSKDRCYGPWISSYLDNQAYLYKNIGGKIEFVKDENLSPWNYCGYDLMHQAGRLQAEFSNSLMLASERGGFVVPAAPINVSLGKELLDRGPLVTSIQVDVSDAGVRTTYKMDLYTASFGKLQKQKQDQVAKMSRERQKLKDERNALIRKGLGKNQTSINYLKQYEDIQRRVNVAMSNVNSSTGAGSAPTVIAVTNRSDQERAYSMEQQAGHVRQNYSSEGSIASFSDIQNVMQGSIGEDGIASAYMNSAATPITQMFTAASNEPFHPNMASRQDPRTSANKSLYFNEDTPFSEKDVV